MLSYTEVSAFDSALRVFDAARKHFGTDGLVLVDFKEFVNLLHSVAAEAFGKVVL